MPKLLAFLAYVIVVVQQPSLNHMYVPSKDGIVAQYSLTKPGDVAFVAHDNLAGASFDELEVGNTILLTYKEHAVVYKVFGVERYKVSGAKYYPEAGSPVQEAMTELMLFEFMYRAGDGRLVLQTCYDGVNGRLFVIAYPVGVIDLDAGLRHRGGR